MLRVRRVDRGGLDQRDGDRRLLELLDLDAQRIGEALNRMLRGAVHALQRDDGVRYLAAHVDQRAMALAQLRQRHQRAVHDAPEVGVEQATAVRF